VYHSSPVDIFLLCGVVLSLVSPGTLESILLEYDIPFLEAKGVISHDATFYPGHDLQAAMGALLQNQLFGDVGGLCDKEIKCEGRQIIQSGTPVRVVKEIEMTIGNDRLRFALIKAEGTEGWVMANALEDVR
jgi:hypothetical protein